MKRVPVCSNLPRVLALFIALGAIPFGACECDTTVGQLPAPSAVLAHGDDETPPLEHLEVGVGAVLLGESKTLTLSLRNDGTALLDTLMGLSSDPTLCPSPSAEFTLASPAQVELAAGNSVDVTVRFTPSSGAPGCAVLRVETNDEKNPVLRAVLTGQGDAAQLCAQNPVLDFGVVYIGDRAEDVVRVTSCGTRPITFQSVSTNAAFPPFEVDASALPITLAPGEAASLPVAFAPSEERAFRTASGTAGVLELQTDAATLYQVALEGEGRRPPSCQLEAIPSSLNFGSVYEDRSASQDIVIRNVGDLACSLASLEVTPAGSSFSASVVGGFSPGAVLDVQEALTVSVTFAPDSPEGAENAVLRVASDDPLSPLDVPLEGTSIETEPCIVEASPSPLSFGNQPMGQTATRTLTISNAGTERCTLTRMELSESSSPDFLFVAPSLPIFLNAGQSRTVDVSFRPRDTAPATGELLLYKGLIPILPSVTVQLSGTGTGPRLCPAPSPVVFGSRPVGDPVDRQLSLANCGSQPLTVSGAMLTSMTSSEFQIVGALPSSPIAPGASFALSLRYTSTAVGSDEGKLRLDSDDGVEPVQYVRLVGAGASGPCGDIKGSICGLDGASPAVGATVYVSTNDGRVETVTDENGIFVLTCVPTGTQTVHVESGNWDTSFNVNVNAYDVTTVQGQQCLDPDSASIAVVAGEWDTMEQILDDMGIPHTVYSENSFQHRTSDLLNDASELAQYDIVMFNCGFEESDAVSSPGIDNLRAFVAGGGSLYGSDWAYDVVEVGWPTYIEFYGDDNARGAAEEGAGDFTGLADVLDPGLEAALGGRQQIAIYSCCTAMESVLPTTSTYLEGDRLGMGSPKPLMVGFEPGAGSGRVFYTDFHASEQDDITEIFSWLLQQL